MKRTLLLMLAVTIMAMMVWCGKKENSAPETTEESSVASNETNTEEPPETEAENGDDVLGFEIAEIPSFTAEEDGINWEYTELDDGTICLIAYETEEIPEIMEVPSTVDGKTVTGIEKLFRHEVNVKKVILPETLTFIGIEAFRSSVSIEEVEINSAIEVIKARAFFRCYGIRSLTFPEGLKNIDEAGIYTNTGLEELHVPGSIEMSADDLSHTVKLFPDTTIYAPSGSAWETYAEKMEITFVAE